MVESKLSRRFFFYFIGLALGTLLSWTLLVKGRNDLPNMWPQGRVIDSFERATIEQDSITFCLLQCMEVEPEGLKAYLGDANVRFSKSFPREFPRRYWLEMSDSLNREWALELALYDSTYRILAAKEVSLVDNPINCICP
jgi:hypothetical protein